MCFCLYFLLFIFVSIVLQQTVDLVVEVGGQGELAALVS